MEAFQLIKKHAQDPVFNVKIGVCSAQVRSVDFETALEEFAKCETHTTEFMEYVAIYVSEFCKNNEEINEALKVFNLGFGRHKLNQKDGLWT